MSMPDPGANLHIASLDYYCTFSLLVAEGGLVSFSCPDPVRFTFAFETGQSDVSPGVVQVSWDYSWFDQAAIEADISAALSQIVAAVAELLGFTVAQVDSAVTVRRVWTYAPNLQGPSVSSGRVAAIDYMAYPPQVTGADTAAAAEAGQAAQS